MLSLFYYLNDEGSLKNDRDKKFIKLTDKSEYINTVVGISIVDILF